VFTREEAVDSKVVEKNGGGEGGLFTIFPFNIMGGKTPDGTGDGDDDPDFPGFTYDSTFGNADVEG
jgi:hypothetical protein